MALSRLRSGINPEDHNSFRIYKAHGGPARYVMLTILNWGCQKPPQKTFEEYIIQDVAIPYKMYRSHFDGEQREKLKSHASGETFDITLLYKVIQITCSLLAPAGDSAWVTEDFSRLEYLLHHIKASRNNLAHSSHTIDKREMVKRLEKLRDTLITTLKAGQELYCISSAEVDAVTLEVSESITAIREHPFAQTDVLQYQNDLLFEDLREIMSTDGAKEVAMIFSKQNLLNLNPISFIGGSDCHLQVDKVFISLQLASIEYGSEKTIDYKDILSYSQDTQVNSSQETIAEKPTIHLIEGNPGTGKTTLLKFIMADWKKQTNNIKDISDFKIVLYYECRNPYKDTIADFLASQMPLTSNRFQKCDLVRCLLSLRVLFLIDGLDELNSASKRFFKEILQAKKTSGIEVICTTRPEKVKEISKMMSGDLVINHFKLRGVPDDKKSTFVELYHEELKKRGLSTQNTKNIVQYVKNAPEELSEFFVYPLNLVLFTYLWATKSLSINRVTSVAVLYAEVHTLMVEKLHKRLMDDPDLDYLPVEEIKSKCERFLDIMYQVSFQTLSQNMIYLEQKHVEMLRDVCNKIGLPAQHMMSAFLMVSATSLEEHYLEKHRFTHKGVQEFYAAMYIMLIITNECFSTNKDQILKDLEKCLSQFGISSYENQEMLSFATDLAEQKSIRTMLERECPVRFQMQAKFTNVLLHLLGLLHHRKADFLDRYAQEIVTLLNDSGDLSFDHWLDVVKVSEYNSTVAKEVSQFVSSHTWTVRDDQEQAVAALIPHHSPLVLRLDFQKPLKHLHVAGLLRAAFVENCEVHLLLHEHWRHPNTQTSDCLAQELQLIPATESPQEDQDSSSGTIRKHGLTCFTGHATLSKSLSSFAATIEELRIAIMDNDDALAWFGNSATFASMIHLEWVGIHVVVKNVDLRLLSHLPLLFRRPHLFLSGVGDAEIETACRVAEKLLPLSEVYGIICFPESSLTSKGLESLAVKLAQAQVEVSEVAVASPNFGRTSDEAIVHLFECMLNCDFVLCEDTEAWTKVNRTPKEDTDPYSTMDGYIPILPENEEQSSEGQEEEIYESISSLENYFLRRDTLKNSSHTYMNFESYKSCKSTAPIQFVGDFDYISVTQQLNKPARFPPPPALNKPSRFPPPPQWNKPARFPPPPALNKPTRFPPPPPQLNKPTRLPPPPHLINPTRLPPPPQLNNPTRFQPPPPQWNKPTRLPPPPQLNNPTRFLPPPPQWNKPTRLPPLQWNKPTRLPPPQFNKPTRLPPSLISSPIPSLSSALPKQPMRTNVPPPKLKARPLVTGAKLRPNRPPMPPPREDVRANPKGAVKKGRKNKKKRVQPVFPVVFLPCAFQPYPPYGYPWAVPTQMPYDNETDDSDSEE